MERNRASLAARVTKLTHGPCQLALLECWGIIAGMQTLCNVRLIARLVLVWFALSLGAAIAAPLVAPKATLLVCSGASVKVLVQGADGDMAEMGHASLDCPLCAVMNAPPPVAQVAVQPPHALALALVPVEAARIAARIGAPWQARAPPAAA